MGVKRREWIRIGLLLLLAGAAHAPRSADAQSLCQSCEVQVGLGGTYHFWGTTGGVVLPVMVTWSENRYELGFVRFGLAGKTKSDELSTTRWDFATQLGVRFRLPGNRVTGELTMRHWSNGGIRLPNHGQDFATLTINLNSGLFGVSKADQFQLDPTFDVSRSLAANNYGSEKELLP